MRNALVGWLGLLAAVLLFASACGDAQISDGAGTRSGPDASEDGAFDPAVNDPPIDDPSAVGPPSTSSDWWAVVAKPDATNTGPNCAASGCPSATLSPNNAPPSTITQKGATYENFTMSGTIVVEADNVTLRNFSLQGSGVNDSTVIANYGRNLVIEFGEIDGGGNCGQILDANGWTVRHSEFRNCADIVKINDSDVGNLGPVLVENSYWHDVAGGHGDTIQIWPQTSSDITFRHNHLEGGNTSIVIDWDINAPARLLFEENWLHGGGAGYVVYCSSSGGGDRIYRDNLFDRGYVYGPVTDSGCTWNNNSYMDNLTPVQ